MATVRKAEIKDIKEIIDIIVSMNARDYELLRYNGNVDKIIKRKIRNIEEEHYVLFIDETESIYGYLEYEVKKDCVWVCSLYIKPTHRLRRYSVWVMVFINMCRSYDMPVRMTVYKDNLTTLSLLKRMQAKEIDRYPDGFIELEIEGGTK